ncbi:competence/damage-inducible protein A [Halapricum desulfuricans]|uniref:Putative nucleotide-utilizing enzyme related tomolybdopterin-biosynthesis enzyme MoeA n=1 Tax=Halapricum desulfuricans TaxID=2841257 RepID=A0A897N669_9EURY|nr:competence/damage-inducible protein A [Halapricum desulfuricans]QSG06525.1 putative nucleotide-utilizing enzyme related tomolybdopterin-biosynthesis enzyme MoeA [Halapricum desulfuricans]
MNVAVLTVGDELLSGDTDNTNGTWLARELTDRGADVRRILALPDDRATIADVVGQSGDTFDAVIVTGGIGGTPDDVTIEAVADAFDRGLVVSEQARARIEQRLSEIGESVPELELDVDAEASIPDGAEPLVNPEGLAPGCRLDNVYVLPGIPGEMKAMFETVAGDFAGDLDSQFLYTVEPEANIVSELRAVREQFGVRVGCYPDREARHNRLKLTGSDDQSLEAATEWLLEAIDASETPVEREWNPDEEPAGGPQ